MKIATFSIIHVFALESRHFIVAAGEILDGTVRSGLIARLADSPEAFEHKIHSIEFVDRTAEGTSHPALVFSYSSPEEAERWKATLTPGASLEIHAV